MWHKPVNGSNTECDISQLMHAAVFQFLWVVKCLDESAAAVSSCISCVFTAVCATALAGRCQLKCDGTRAETRLRLSAIRTSLFTSARGRQFSRLLAAEVCASSVVMLDTPCSEVVWRVLATHSIRQFPPSLPQPCVNLCHHISTGV